MGKRFVFCSPRALLFIFPVAAQNPPTLAGTLRSVFLVNSPVLKGTTVPAMPSLDQIQTTLWDGKANAFGPNCQRLL